jgi:hypothetical protein
LAFGQSLGRFCGFGHGDDLQFFSTLRFFDHQ